MNNIKELIIFKVNAGNNFGFGHLNRCLILSNLLQDRYEILFAITGDDKTFEYIKSKVILYIKLNKNKEFLTLLKKKKPALVISDFRNSQKSFTKKIRKYSKILSIDDLGDGSAYSNMTIHSLPTPSENTLKANFSGNDYLLIDPALFGYKKKAKEPDQKRILTISFGGADPYGLTAFTYRLLQKVTHSFQINVVLGPLYKGEKSFPDTETIIAPVDFHKILKESDLIITSFGLTVFEALALKLTVITVNPTNYHDDLAKQIEGIINLGLGVKENENNITKGLEKMLNSKTNLLPAEKLEGKGFERLSGIVDEVIKNNDDLCPICYNPPIAIEREDSINFYHCPNCHTFFRSSHYSYSESYSDDYFTSQYTNQYGKSYLEDKNQINRFNTERLKIIQKLSSVEKERVNLKLLELGSAMGFFLEKARDLNYEVYGVEISNYASGYAQKELNLNVNQCHFDEYNIKEGYYDIIAAWYFIEHHPDYKSVLRKVKKGLKQGGLLALSTPNTYGVSFRSNPENYIKIIPKDHYIEFSPISLSKLLKQEGFKIEKIVIKGYHYRRFILGFKLRFLDYLFLDKPITQLMKVLKMGDTFEIYARKL